MSDNQATPGPWEVHEVMDDGEVISRGVQRVGGKGINTGECYEMFSVADAHLIAAAPEMKEACELALKALPCLKVENWPPGWDLKPQAIAKLKAALAKAEGRTS
jgi:hypothetical protein